MLDVRASSKYLSLEHFDVVNDADEQACTEQGMDNGPGNESTKRAQQKRMMTEDEIVGQSFIFLLAGYETSSNTLAFTCYLLALYPECQNKLQDEVDEFFSIHVSQDLNMWKTTFISFLFWECFFISCCAQIICGITDILFNFFSKGLCHEFCCGCP